MFQRSILDIQTLEKHYRLKLETKYGPLHTFKGNLSVLNELYRGGKNFKDNPGELYAHAFLSIEVPYNTINTHRLSVLRSEDQLLLSGTLDLWRDAIINWNSVVATPEEKTFGLKIKSFFRQQGLGIIL